MGFTVELPGCPDFVTASLVVEDIWLVVRVEEAVRVVVVEVGISKEMYFIII